MDKSEIVKGNPYLLDLTPVKAIRAKCLDCCCGSSNEVDLCPKDGVHSDLCPLYKYRKGHNPNITREYTEEERRIAAERLAKHRRIANESNATKGFDDSDVSSGM